MPSEIDKAVARAAKKRGVVVPPEQSNVGGVTGAGFMPGESGNPNGRPSLKDELTAMMAEMDDVRGKRKTRVLAETWYELAARGSVQAMLGLWDRLEGAPKQTLEVTIRDLSDEALNAEIAQLERELAALDAPPDGRASCALAAGEAGARQAPAGMD